MADPLAVRFDSPIVSLPSTDRRLGPRPLDKRHELYAFHRAKGKTIKVSAAEAGVSETSGKKWDDDERVIALVARFRQERVNRIAAKAAEQVEKWLDSEALPTNQLIDLFKLTMHGDGPGQGQGGTLIVISFPERPDGPQ